MIKLFSNKGITILWLVLILSILIIPSIYLYNYFKFTTRINSEIVSDFATTISGIAGLLANLIIGIIMIQTFKEQKKAVDIQKCSLDEARIYESINRKKGHLLSMIQSLENEVSSFKYIMKEVENDGKRETLIEHGRTALILISSTAKKILFKENGLPLKEMDNLFDEFNFLNLYNLLNSVNNIFDAINLDYKINNEDSTNDLQNSKLNNYFIDLVCMNLNQSLVNCIVSISKFASFYVKEKQEEYKKFQVEIERVKSEGPSLEDVINLFGKTTIAYKIYRDFLVVAKLESLTESILRKSNNKLNSHW